MPFDCAQGDNEVRFCSFCLVAFGTNALYQQIEMFGMVTLRQLYRRNVQVFEAIGFAARAAFEMDMIVLVLFFGTAVRA